MCDERFEALTLIQTKKIVDFPMILMGKAYWTPSLDFFSQMVREETMSASDLTLLLLTDSIEEAALYIQCDRTLWLAYASCAAPVLLPLGIRQPGRDCPPVYPS
jgi:putative lysine decarboxylase